MRKTVAVPSQWAPRAAWSGARRGQPVGKKGQGSDLLSVETSGAGREVQDVVALVLGRWTVRKGEQNRSGDQRDAGQPLLGSAQRFLGGPHPLCAASCNAESAVSVAFIVTGGKLRFRRLFCKFQGCNRT